MKPPNPGYPNLTPLLTFLFSVKKITFTQLLTLKTQRSSSFFSLHHTGRNQQADAIGSIFKVISRISSQLVQATHPSLTWMTAISLTSRLSTSALLL